MTQHVFHFQLLLQLAAGAVRSPGSISRDQRQPATLQQTATRRDLYIIPSDANRDVFGVCVLSKTNTEPSHAIGDKYPSSHL